MKVKTVQQGNYYFERTLVQGKGFKLKGYIIGLTN